MMAVRQRRPKRTVIHSDQGSQYGSDDWRRFCRTNHLEPSMSRRGNCWDNAVAESFFSSLKKEHIKSGYTSTEEGKAKLMAFRALVEKKLCKQWETAQELGSVVSRRLIQLMKTTPALGWVRANELADREATMELLQLRRRVDELESELSRLRTTAPKSAEGLAQGSEQQTLRFSFTAYDSRTLRFQKVEERIC
jgi:transposase InsO family protein